MEYNEFLCRKQLRDPATGFDPPPMPECLYDWQAAITAWALRRGRAALFEDCGLGKTLQQLAWAHAVAAHAGGPVLILAPLAVARQTHLEGKRFGLPCETVHEQDGVGGGVHVTNYHKLHRFDPSAFAGVVLDESSILKGIDGKTRAELTAAFAKTPFRLCCTATPAPNDFMELAHHAEFLGVMGRAEMLGTFFVHDGGATSQWRLKGHARGAFWRWLCSWSIYLRSPADLGFSDAGFDLPELCYFEHVLPVERPADALFPVEAKTLAERRAARRATIEGRAAKVAEIVSAEPDEPWVVWCNLNAEASAVVGLIPGAVEVRGSDPPEAKERALERFSEGSIRVLVTKPTIAGFGLNWQHCARQAFLGLSDSFEQKYQAVRRSWRFGQQRPVNVHIVIAETEGAVLRNVQRKEEQAAEMAARMVAEMTDIESQEVRGIVRERAALEHDRDDGDGWVMILGDAVEEVARLDPGSVDYTVFSPPFASLYTYSASDRDMGNCADDAVFAEHFRFLVDGLLRATAPGRLCSVHCMTLPSLKSKDGEIGLKDFRGDIVRIFQAAGWVWSSEVVIWKDPVTQMQRTKALGLLWKQVRKDSAMVRQAINEYVVTFRAPGDNPRPISRSENEFPVELWQRWASGVWTDINPSDTLQFRSVREDADERHICPLQLEVVRRCIHLWSNPEDLVLSPFAGIGSEGYEALKAGRNFIGVELRRSYWQQAVNNLRAAETERPQLHLFPVSVR